ncbi:MAG: hypothetical protein ACYCT1_14795 [Steroidobacteraceae bacterium]
MHEFEPAAGIHHAGWQVIRMNGGPLQTLAQLQGFFGWGHAIDFAVNAAARYRPFQWTPGLLCFIQTAHSLVELLCHNEITPELKPSFRFKQTISPISDSHPKFEFRNRRMGATQARIRGAVASAAGILCTWQVMLLFSGVKIDVQG